MRKAPIASAVRLVERGDFDGKRIQAQAEV